MVEHLRITGGSRRGRRLQSPPRNTIRPASDMVRQAVFNMLVEVVENVVFYDIFAGTGIVGMEALSRGAERAIFIEQDRRQLDLIQRNLTIARFTNEASVRGSDAFKWGQHFSTHGQPTIVFLGPPYPLFASDMERINELLRSVMRELQPGDRMVLQFPFEVKPEELPGCPPRTKGGEWHEPTEEEGGWIRMRRYGKTRIGIWAPAGSGGSAYADDESDEDRGDEEFEGGPTAAD